MLSEKEFEDIICKYPDLIEEGLLLKGRQIRVYGKIIDVLFKDKFGQKLIVELKAGPIDRKHIGQVMEYEGNILSDEDPTARIMLVGNRVPPNLKKALDHHGIEWREITQFRLREFIKSKNDNCFAKVFGEKDEEYNSHILLRRTSRISQQPEEVPKKYLVDWRRPESHLALISNKETLERVNYLRDKIRQIGSDVEESGRQKWIKYLVNRRLFANIGEFRRNGAFWGSVNFAHHEVQLPGYDVKSWGTTEWAIIRFGPDTSYKDLDKYIELAKKSYDKNKS